MKSNARQDYPETPSRTEKTFRAKHEVGVAMQSELDKDMTPLKANFSTFVREQRPITEQAGRLPGAGGVQAQRTMPDISSNEYFMPKKRIQHLNNGG